MNTMELEPRTFVEVGDATDLRSFRAGMEQGFALGLAAHRAARRRLGVLHWIRSRPAPLLTALAVVAVVGTLAVGCARTLLWVWSTYR